jgi:hypothetical protein
MQIGMDLEQGLGGGGGPALVLLSWGGTKYNIFFPDLGGIGSDHGHCRRPPKSVSVCREGDFYGNPEHNRARFGWKIVWGLLLD